LTAPGAELREQTHQRLADQYQLLLFSEITLNFTDTDGDHIRLQKDGIDINEYVNGKLEVRSGKFFHIDTISGAYRIGAGHGWFGPQEDVATLVRKRDLMFMDREFTARCLMMICSLKESAAYQVMMTAHTEGLAVVGIYTFEAAEAYCDGLKAKGLSADIVPVDGNCD
jgi:ATP-dependent Clp protease adapter protein ClpS